MEFLLGIPLLPVLKKFSSFIFGDLISGPSIVGTVGFGGNSAGKYDFCAKTGEATGKLFISPSLALSLTGGQFPAGLPNGGSVTGEFRPLDVGVVGQGELTLREWDFRGIGGDTKMSLDVFVKSQFSIGSLGWTLFDIRAPIIPDIPGKFLIPVPNPL